MISFFIRGEPAPQGSKTAFVRGRRAVLVETSKKLPEWRKRIEDTARREYEGEPIDQPVKVTVDFFMPKPQKPRFKWPATAPDLDKLCRAIGDGLEKGGVLRNDSRITHWEARKSYANTPEKMGAHITITTL